MSKMLRLIATFLVLSCSLVYADPSVSRPEVALTGSEGKLLVDEALRLWAKRDLKDSLQEALSKFELAHAATPQDLDVLVYLTRGYYLLGDGHEENDDLKKRAFEKAVSYGDKALALNEEFTKTLDKKNLESAIEVLTDKEVPAMFWTAAALGKYARATGIFASLKHKGKIQGLVKRVEKLRPNYFFGAVPRYWGGYYAIAPGIAGGDMKKSKQEFTRSLEMAPEYLGTKVLMAEVYYTKEDDKDQFKKLLLEVLADKSQHPEIAPENNIERRKAEKLLEKIDDLF